MKKKVWIIGLCLVVAGYFVLSLCDFMYISADKYPTIIRTMFFPDDKNITVKTIGNVCQVEDGIYLIYEGRLMYMDNEGNIVETMKSNVQPIWGIMKSNSDIFCVKEDPSVLYKIDTNKEQGYSSIEKKAIELLIKDNVDKYYIDSKYIYLFNGDMLSKYTMNGKMVYSSKIHYDRIRAGGFGSAVFNEYSMRMIIGSSYDPGMGVDVPYHYLFGWNKVKYKPKRLNTFHYYKDASRWDHNNTSNVLEHYDTWAKKLNEEIRTNASKVDGMKDRNMKEYDLVSIGLSKKNPDYYRVVNGYIYFYQPMDFCYRDKNYIDKIKFNDAGSVSSEEIDKVEFVTSIYVMLRVKVEDIEKAEDGSNLKYEIINTPMYPIDSKDFIENYEVNDNFLYTTSNGRFSKYEEEEKIKVFITDMDTSSTTLIYSRIKGNKDRYRPGLYCSDNYVFLYEYSYISGDERCRITRFDKDGKNPMLVVDYTGEVVMKSVEPVQ